MKLQEIVSDEEIKNAWSNIIYPIPSKRAVIEKHLLSCVTGKNQNLFVNHITNRLGLTYIDYTLTKKGKEYMYYAFKVDENEDLDSVLEKFGDNLKDKFENLYGYSLFAFLKIEDGESSFGIHHLGYENAYFHMAIIENAIESLKTDFDIIMECKVIDEKIIIEQTQ